MYKGQHYKFITTPLSKILEDGVNASRGIGGGIETYPLCDYIMQSIFLKMTGAQEQKMKCICWEMATNDYEYRRKYLENTKKDYGEFSKYDQKNIVYSDLLKQIRKFDKQFSVEKFKWLVDNEDDAFNKSVNIQCSEEIKKQEKNKSLTGDEKQKIKDNITASANSKREEYIIRGLKILFGEKTKNYIVGVLQNMSFSIWQYDCFSIFKESTFFSEKNFASRSSILENDLKKIYENDVIVHRHRCAHNITSYQQNLPTLDTLASPDYIYHNYFFRFAILILIDEIFICLYKKYVEALENNINW